MHSIFKLLVLLGISTIIAANIHDRLSYFETLHHVDVKVRKKRSTDGSGTITKDLSFSAMGRNFNLILTPGSPVIAAGFKANLVYGNGRTSPLHINENIFFTGHLAEDESVKADAYVEGDLWSADIYMKNEIYSMEPAWRHLPPSSNHSMIIYRHSDIKWDHIFPGLSKEPNQRHKVCKELRPEDDEEYNPKWDEEPKYSNFVENNATDKKNGPKHLSRKRRGISRNTCHILAVADYHFFKGPGGGLPHNAANYIISSIQKVDSLYRSTVWDMELGLTNIGLQIKELDIHPEFTKEDNYADNGKHYNMKPTDPWPDVALLKQFGREQKLHDFCLGHLFTHQKFADGVLGLAYIASPRRSAQGGICSPRRSTRAMNTGFSSSMNTRGGNLLTMEANLVTAHEFGHNFGSEHDADTAECAPNAYNNGKYLMYPYAVSGYDENNKKFSPCSKRYVSAVLAARASGCFKDLKVEEEEESVSDNIPLCGNAIIDKGEECDGGSIGLNDMDPCCSPECKLIGEAKCSSINYQCCVNCTTASKDTVCRGASDELCIEEAKCTGNSWDCPPSRFKPNNTVCIDEGKCFDGVCQDFCSALNMEPCRCLEPETTCFRCCKHKNGPCEKKGGALPIGRPCAYGYCEEDGVCKKGKPVIYRLFAFIEHLDTNSLVAFMQTNIVCTVIVLSLIIWVPASWVVSCIDKRNEKKSHMFTHTEEPPKVREATIYRPPVPRGHGDMQQGAPPPYRGYERYKDGSKLPPIMRDEDVDLLPSAHAHEQDDPMESAL